MLLTNRDKGPRTHFKVVGKTGPYPAIKNEKWLLKCKKARQLMKANTKAG